MNKVLLTLTILFIGCVTYAQQTCRVKVAEIEGKYQGGCKKGYADGKGTAEGLYKYVGEFKKGKPHGTGTITWKPDSSYTGEWEKGVISGKGLLVSKGDTLTGFWAQNDYLGKENFRYKLITNANEIGKVMFTRLDNGMNRIEIRYEKETVPVPMGNLNVVVSQGAWDRNLRGTAYVRVLENVVYPFQANVSNQFEFIINQPGHWDILVMIVPKRN